MQWIDITKDRTLHSVAKLEDYWREQGAAEVLKRIEDRRSIFSVIRPSSAGKAVECIRQLVYDGLFPSEAKPITGQGLRTLLRGNTEHADHRSWLLHAGVEIQALELRLYYKLPSGFVITGSIDGSIVHSPGVHDVFDIKSTSDFEFDRWLRGNPSERTEAQVNFYFEMLKKGFLDPECTVPASSYWEEYDLIPPVGITLFGVSKTTQAYHMLRTERLDEKLLAATIKGFLDTEECLKELEPKGYESISQLGENDLPARGFKAAHGPGAKRKTSGTLPWQCGYCSFAHDCWRPYNVKATTQNPHDLTIDLDITPEQLLTYVEAKEGKK